MLFFFPLPQLLVPPFPHCFVLSSLPPYPQCAAFKNLNKYQGQNKSVLIFFSSFKAAHTHKTLCDLSLQDCASHFPRGEPKEIARFSQLRRTNTHAAGGAEQHQALEGRSTSSLEILNMMRALFTVLCRSTLHTCRTA